MIPEEAHARVRRAPPITEEEYFKQDKEKLSSLRCPQCKAHELFRGGVYIGCRGCMTYFSEKEIIEENLEGEANE